MAKGALRAGYLRVTWTVQRHSEAKRKEGYSGKYTMKLQEQTRIGKLVREREAMSVEDTHRQCRG